MERDKKRALGEISCLSQKKDGYLL
jgi:hypothetical protein